GRSPAVRSTDSPPTPPGLGRLYQTGLWRSDAGVALSGPLHPSGGHFQSSIIGLRWRACHFPLEGLRPRWQVGPDDAQGIRVLASLLPACAAQGVRPHPSLRISSESLPCPSGIPLPTTADPSFLHRRPRCVSSCLWGLLLALPELRRDDDRARKIHCCGTVTMRLFRFFLGLQPPVAFRPVCAGRSPCVPVPRAQVSAASFRRVFAAHHRTRRRSLQISCSCSAARLPLYRYQTTIQSP